MKRSNLSLITIVAVVAAIAVWRLDNTPTRSPAPTPNGSPRSSANSSQLPAFVPAEARDTLMRIADNGPFRHRQDGSVFGNREHLLPPEPRGYYREYTVETPGIGYRGARRIITGGRPPVAYYYSEDHYRSFHSFEVPQR